MDGSLFTLVGFGLVAIAVALTLLLAMVHWELGPVLGLGLRRRWLLAGLLGSGILAFALKLVMILIFAYFPDFGEEPPANRVTDARTGQGQGDGRRVEHQRWQRLPGAQELDSGALPANSGYQWQPLPTTAPAPADNPTTAAKVALGRRLFFDPLLSRDRTLSCSSCHPLERGGADGLPTALGIDGKRGQRNTPTVWNAAFQSRLFWDGRAGSLEEQAAGPIFNPAEMGMVSEQQLIERLQRAPDYREMFTAAFSAEAGITLERVTDALAAYERTLITPDTPYDRFLHGERDALTPQQLRGMALFQSLGCINCHSGPNFSAASSFTPGAPLRLFPAIATPYEEELGLSDDRGAATEGRGVWRVPSLRNVALTAPYFHNGSVATLKEAVRVMSAVQLGYRGRYQHWSAEQRRLTRVATPVVSDADIEAVVAFLHALSSERLQTQSRALHSEQLVRYDAGG